MKSYITIDGGTTNTRISIVSDGKIVDTLKVSGINNKAGHKEAVKEKIKELLKKNAYRETDIIRILASGTMATSELGLYPLEHLVIPVDIEKLKKESCEVLLPEISDIPFVFIRGVKTLCDSLENADMMRGEETEIMGIMSPDDKECMYMLMGSHTKIVKTDDEGNIVDLCTMLTGEMLEAISKDTILKHAVHFDGSVLDREYIKRGYMYCKEKGMNESLFKVRILKNIFQETDSEIYSFFIGAVLHGEVEYVLNSNVKRIVIGGNKYLKEAIAMLLDEYMDGQVVCLSNDIVDSSVSAGLVKIFEYSI